MASFAVGEAVQGLWINQWLDATIVVANPNGTFQIKFAVDGALTTVNAQQLRRGNGQSNGSSFVMAPAARTVQVAAPRMMQQNVVYVQQAPKIGDHRSVFANVEMAPADPILSLTTKFKDDTFPNKVNLGVGAYRTAEGKPWILDSVKEAERLVTNDPKGDKEYQPIDGQPAYKRAVQELCFTSEVCDTGSIATCQALSGTGSLQVIGQFLKQLGVKKIFGPDPTWGNHPKIFQRAGLEYGTYPYWHQPTRGLDFAGMMAAINRMNEGDAILLHSVAHNPTGVDPTDDQWRQIVAALKQRKLITLLDNAYQGYASGSVEKDGFAQYLLAEEGMEFFIAQSFAKNFGLYGERIGYIHVKCADKDRASAVLSQLKIVVRQAYSSPPKHGAAIVNTILTTPRLKAKWLGELKMMAERIDSMRTALRSAIEAKGTPGTWNHVTDQIGMFTFTGLDKAQVKNMVDEHHIYMTADGRISVAGLNPNNVSYVADCIDKVVRG